MRGSVGSPTSIGQGLIEVNISGGTFLLLQGLLVGGERGSKNINTPFSKCKENKERNWRNKFLVFSIESSYI